MVRNSGRGVARDVRVCDVLPKRVTVVSRGGGTLRDGRVCWTVKRLAPGASRTFRLTLRIDRDARGGGLTNRATASGRGLRTTRTVTARRTVRVVPRPRRTSSRVTG